MFGLIMGMSIFSALSLQWANKELAEYRLQQIQRVKTNAADVAKGLNFSILAESENTFSESYGLDRARKFSNSTGRTQGNQDYLVTERPTDKESYGQRHTTVAITGSDDTLLRSQMYRSADAEEILRTKTGDSQAVAVYDTSTARDRQIRTTIARMESLAEQVYAFYAARQRFPSPEEFTTLAGTFGLKDSWGQSFAYEPGKDLQTGTLGFTTPWNYSHSINLSLKDDATPAQ